MQTEPSQTDIPLNQILDESHKLYRENLQDKNHTAFFAKSENFQIINLRFFKITNMDFVVHSRSFILTESDFYTYDIETDTCTPIESYDELYAILLQETQDVYKLLFGYINQIETLEDTLYSRNISAGFMDYWFGMKKDISKMERIFARNIFVLSQFIKTNTTDESFINKEFHDLYEEVDHHQRLCSQHLSKLDTLYNYHSSLKSDKMNTNIYVLTLLSGIFLPLNLLVGFFGMNTQNMYLGQNPEGTLIVTYTLGILFVILLIGLPVAKKLEVLIIRKLFGRYGFYKALQKHIKHITNLEP